MSLPSRPGRTAIAVGIVAVALLFSGCAPATTDGGAGTNGTSTEIGTPEPDPDPTPEPDPDPDPDPDPGPTPVRTGPMINYGGPAYGDQGETELIEPGLWCETVAVFWGGSESIPEGVVVTFTDALVDSELLEVTSTPCGVDPGSGEPLPSCIGLVLEANASAFCGLAVRPGPVFADGTVITFGGTMECPSVEACDQVEARETEQGPQIVVDTPSGA